jgi:hypothetical protein
LGQACFQVSDVVTGGLNDLKHRLGRGNIEESNLTFSLMLYSLPSIKPEETVGCMVV